MAETERLKSSMTISKAIGLITDKQSDEMIERHLRALNRISIKNKHGFLLKDLSALSKLLVVCANKLHTNPAYREALCRLIELCGLPFLKEKASDENTYAPQVVEVLTTLGRLVCMDSEPVRAEVAKAIASFCTEQVNQALIEGLQMTRVTFNAALVERSAIAKSLIEACCKCEEHSTRYVLLQTIQMLSVTPTNCNHMLSVGGAHFICDSFTLPDPEQRILFIGMEIMWNLLEYGSQIQVAKQLSNRKCIRVFKDVFYDLMMSASSVQSKQLRNDLLMICLRVVQICPDAPFVETGFLKYLCLFANYPEESGSRPHLQDTLRGLKLTQQHEDFELKKGLLCMLSSLSGDLAAVKVMAEEKVIRSLLSFVTRNDKVEKYLWNPAQFEELQLLALSCLSSLAPFCLDDYMTCQGNTRLLMLVEWCTKQEEEFKGHGNSFHGEGGRGTKLSQLRYSLRLLLNMCSGGDDVMHQDLHEQGAIPLLLGVLRFLLEQSSTEGVNSRVLLEMQADILLIISCICELEVHRKELFGGYDGVKLLISYLKRDIDKFGSGLGHHRLLLAAVDCVWCTVVGNAVVEDMFLEQEGVLVLLDVLNTCPENIKNLVLGVLVDLCENPKAIPHVAAWRASDKCSVWSLLARLWRNEEHEMEVPRGSMNALAGTQQPLVGAEQNACGVPPIPSHCPSASIIDVTENMRAKVYALCCKLGFNYHSDELSTEDKITLYTVEGYLDFKAGEVWYEVAGELAQEGLRPVTPDQECLTEIWQVHEEKAEEILKKQHELIEEKYKHDQDEELEFYETIQQLHQMEEKAERDFNSFVARTSNYKTLKEAKKYQLNVLDASRRSSVAIGDRFHSLDNHGLNVTTFCGRHVSIATTPMKLLTAPGTIVAAPPQRFSQPRTTLLVDKNS